MPISSSLVKQNITLNLTFNANLEHHLSLLFEWELNEVFDFKRLIPVRITLDISRLLRPILTVINLNLIFNLWGLSQGIFLAIDVFIDTEPKFLTKFKVILALLTYWFIAVILFTVQFLWVFYNYTLILVKRWTKSTLSAWTIYINFFTEGRVWQTFSFRKVKAVLAVFIITFWDTLSSLVN